MLSKSIFTTHLQSQLYKYKGIKLEFRTAQRFTKKTCTVDWFEKWNYSGFQLQDCFSHSNKLLQFSLFKQIKISLWGVTKDRYKFKKSTFEIAAERISPMIGKLWCDLRGEKRNVSRGSISAIRISRTGLTLCSARVSEKGEQSFRCVRRIRHRHASLSGRKNTTDAIKASSVPAIHCQPARTFLRVFFEHASRRFFVCFPQST